MNIDIANRLYELRKRNNLSQEDLAEKIGVSRQAATMKNRKLPAARGWDSRIHCLSQLFF